MVILKLAKDVTLIQPITLENYSVISAITKTKILGYQIYRGAITGKEFGAFMINFLLNNKEILANLSKYCFFMDNAPIHRAEILKPFLWNIQYLF